MADGIHFAKYFQKNKVVYRCEMARNAIESEFWTSKMADGSHYVKNFQKKLKLHIDEMARNVIEREFRTSKMGCWWSFCKTIFF